MDNCGLSREELEWFTSVARNMLSVAYFAEEYLYRNLINEFISGLFAMNCNIALNVAVTSRSLGYVFKCGKDVFIDAIIYDEHLDHLNEQLRKRLLYEEVEIDEEAYVSKLRLSHLTIGIFSPSSMGERLAVYYGRFLELLQRGSVQYYLAGIEETDSSIYFIVIAKESSKPSTNLYYITKYRFNKNGECIILSATDWYWFDPQKGVYQSIETNFLPPSAEQDHLNILKTIYSKRKIIEERINNAIYLTVKIPSIILLY